MYSKLFNLLCDKADDVYGGRLPVHVRCLLDEFANIDLITKFKKIDCNNSFKKNISKYNTARTISVKRNL